MKGYTVVAQEIKEYRLVSLDTRKDIFATGTEELVVKAFNNFTKLGHRLEIQKVIRLIVDVEE